MKQYGGRWQRSNSGFTIVELLVVIVIIAILSVIAVVSYNGISDNAKRTAALADLKGLSTLIQIAQTKTGKSLREIGAGPPAVWEGMTNGHHGGPADGIDHPCGPDMTTVFMSDEDNECVQVYLIMLDRLEEITGESMDRLRAGDPWGRPYVIDDDEEGSIEEDCLSADRLVSAGKDGWRGDFNRDTWDWYKQRSFSNDHPGIVMALPRATDIPGECDEL